MVTTPSKRGTFPQLRKNAHFRLALCLLTGQINRLPQQSRVILASAAQSCRIEPNTYRTTRFRRLI